MTIGRWGAHRVRCRLSMAGAVLFVLASPLVLANTSIVFDAEPNDEPAEAVPLPWPGPGETLRVLGALQDEDQDAYRLVIDEDRAGARLNLRLSASAGAVTKLDIFDFTPLVDDRGRIPAELTQRPERVFTLSVAEAGRPVQSHRLLLAPGTYLFGLSHSGGEVQYSFEVAGHDDHRVAVPGDEHGLESPLMLDPRGRVTAVWTAGETHFAFEVNGAVDARFVDLEYQLPAGHEASMQLVSATGETLVTLAASGGLPVARRSLALQPGPYRLVSDVRAAAVQMVSVSPGAPPVDGDREVEPNDRHPNAIDFGQEIAGTFEHRDTDLLAFTVTDAEAERKFELALESAPAASPELCLNHDERNLQQCMRAGDDGRAQLLDLVLTPGRYTLTLRARGEVPADWRLLWAEAGELRAGEEAEPNDKPHLATPLHERGFGRGRFVGSREIDYWRFQVAGEPALWRIQLRGDDLHSLALLDAAGERIQTRSAGTEPRVRLDNLFLEPGDYFIEARGTDADYMVRVLSLGPPPEGMELEPNDEYHNAGMLRFGQEAIGTLASADDQDRFRFELLGYERIRLSVVPPVDGGIRGRVQVGDETQTLSDIRHGGRPGEPLVWDLFLPPGDYSLLLTPGETSVAEYTVLMERGDFLDKVVDREPNDSRDIAAPLPPDGRVIGRVGETAAGEDWYALGRPLSPVTLALPRVRGLRLAVYGDDAPGTNLLEHDRDTGVQRAGLNPDTEYWLQLRGDAEYDFDLSALLATPAGASADSTLAVGIELPDAPVQAYSPWRQRLEGRLVVANHGEATASLVPETHLTDLRWSLTLGDMPASLAAGERIDIPLSLTVAPDARADWPVQLSVTLGYGARATAEISADAGVAPVAPSFHWAVPEPLRGGFNAAALRFGAEPESSSGAEDDLEEIARLFDNLAPVGPWAGFRFVTDHGARAARVLPTVRLAGDEAVPVEGFLVNPTASLSPSGYLGKFAIAVSLDGERWDRVVEDAVDPLAMEQAFVLETPVMARYARLIPLTAAFGDAGGSSVRIGQFKVIAARGWRPDSGPINLAAPQSGGHLVWSDPWLRKSAFETGMLVADGDAPRMELRGDTRGTLVLGFEHGRAARLDTLSLRQVSDAEAGSRPSRVHIATSVDGPLGPWHDIGAFELGPTDAGIDLPGSRWARFVRLIFETSDPVRWLQLPDRIAIHEAGGGESILGEWGHAARHGPLEAAKPPRFLGPSEPSVNRSRETSITLSSGETRNGRALLGEYSAWYRLPVPHGQNRVEVTLIGASTLEAAPRLFDDDGGEVALRAIEREGPRHRWRANVDPAREYFLEVYEPPRSVLFSWDTSGSVARYRPIIKAALLNYAATVRPGRDEVNLLPFGYAQPMLTGWQGHAWPLRRMLAADPRETSSSAAEATLAVAARAMAGRPGKRAILLLTDAATSTSADLWPALQQGRPQVFAMRLPGGGALGSNLAGYEDLMQDWAAVSAGDYTYAGSIAQLQMASDRAIARLRRAAVFEVSVNFERVDDPSPARLSVVSPPDGLAPDALGAVALILDASGSMLKRMDGKRRIDIAKDAIARSIDESLPAGLPLALRVYGHREAGSCRTDLEIPLAPLDKAAFFEHLERIEAINLARTPIAESLAAVASDLANADGRRLVVLLTDGEETCAGDPLAAIEALRDGEVDVRINVVGFALDDESVRQEFATWAAKGGGRYFDAVEETSLVAAMSESLRVPFSVLDATGDEIAEGRVDGAVLELEPGRYQLRIDTAVPRTITDVDLAPGMERRIELD